MRIAICDDQKEFLLSAKEQITSICRLERIPIQIECFFNPKNLIKAFSENEYDYDLVLLDIDMPEMNGKECAQKLRTFNKHFKLIFITSYKEEVYTSFDYNISGFIPKFMLQNCIYHELKRVFSQIAEEQKQWIPFEIKSDKGEYIKIKFPIADIMFFESINRKIYIHTLKNIYVLRYSGFENLKKSMYAYNFIEIHRLCIVNLDCIYKIKDDSLELENHESLPISRRHTKQVMQSFTNYLRQDLI